MKPRILIVDDEENLVDFLRLLFEGQNYAVTVAHSVTGGREALDGANFDLLLCDLTMPDGNGLELLREIKRQREELTAVIMMTAYTSTESAIEAMKLGAYDYVSKPFDVEELKLLVEKALEKTQLFDENAYLRRELEERYTFSNIIGRSGRMLAIYSLIEKIAKTPSTVLIQGESGTGKELIARAIHFNSNRSDRRFLSINCGALPENLLESELFGHERGAFTGAVKEKRGLFQEASGGTLFLDEIGEMSTTMQVKLLRAIQERRVRKVGGNHEEEIDVRILAATNRDLEEAIGAGTFREDLYYRINVIPIRLPPLRKRREDIPLLVDHFLKKYGQQMDAGERHGERRFSVEAMRHLEDYAWPGNVRELENIIERTLALASSEVITAADLPPSLVANSGIEEAISLPAEGIDLEAYLERLRSQLMAEALARCDSVQTQAAELLGMTFRSFRYYARKAGLTSGRQDGSEDGSAEDSGAEDGGAEDDGEP